jgi:hypothetical protein
MGLAGLGPVLHEALRDKDGAVTRAAYDAAVKAQFDKADTNHDGKLTREELRAAFGHGGHRWGPRGMEGHPPPPPGPTSGRWRRHAAPAASGRQLITRQGRHERGRGDPHPSGR